MIIVLGAVSAAFSEPVDVRFGFDEPASIEWITGERVEIEWKQIDDSRCATGATCVWEGQVTVTLGVVVDGGGVSDSTGGRRPVSAP